MKKLSLVVLFLALGSLTLAGCSTSRTAGGPCWCMNANCCSWDFYQECDLIEGRANNCCACPDDNQCCDPNLACSGHHVGSGGAGAGQRNRRRIAGPPRKHKRELML